ncbi:MAG: hypothetical protein PVG35_17600 [Desulfobacterales bacterium]|jgi:hypothetical protein
MKNKNDDMNSETLSKPDKHYSPALGKLLKTLRVKGISTIAGLSKNDMIRLANWANQVFNDYAVALESLPMKIKHNADLPHPKEDIKMAIKILLLTHVSKGSDDMVTLLKERYVRLSTFQEIRREDQENLIKESCEMNNQTGSTVRPTFTTYNKYIDLIVAEQNVLVEDINTFIEDLPSMA